MYTCIICGHDKLTEKPYDQDGNPSYEICKCCGFEFGFDDNIEGNSIEGYRQKWIDGGAEWFNAKAKPENWDLKKQLRK